MQPIKNLVLGILGLGLLLGISAYLFVHSVQPKEIAASTSYPINAERLGDLPIISSEMHPMLLEEAKSFGNKNINGPSLIRVPEWVEDPLVTYYL